MKITQSYFNLILKDYYLFEKQPKIAVAVSGGPDSMALLFLLNVWIKKNKGSLVALIVDHKMRKDSGKEAKMVCDYLKKHKIRSKIINISKKNVHCCSEISEVTINKCYKKLDKHRNKLIPNMVLKKYAD